MNKWLGYALIGLVLLIEIPRFFGAYSGIDTSSLTALGTGIVLPVGAGYMLHTWWKTQRQGREWLLVVFGVLLVLEPVILVPWGLSRLWAEPLGQVLGRDLWAVGWMTVVMVSPFLMTAGVVMALAFQKDERRHTEPERKAEAAVVKRMTYAEATRQIPDLLRKPTADAAQLAGVSERTIRNWRNNGHAG